MAAPSVGSAARPGQQGTPARQGVGSPVFPATDQATPGSAGASVEWTDVQDVTASLPIEIGALNVIEHAPSGVTAGTYGDATHFPNITVEADGHVTAASQVAVPTPPVTSVFGRTGAIVAVSGDYSVGQVTGAAPLASPALTGTPTAPTAAQDTNTTQIATTAFVDGQAGTATPIVDGTGSAGVSLRYSRQDHVHPTDTSRAPLASPTFTGTPAAPTNSTNTDNSTQIATDAFVQSALKLAFTNGKFSVTLIGAANPYTLLDTDIVVINNSINVSSFPLINLPAASHGVRVFFVINARGTYATDGGGSLGIQRNGGAGGTDTLNGLNQANFPLMRNGFSAAIVFSDGVSGWYSINAGLDLNGGATNYSVASGLALSGANNSCSGLFSLTRTASAPINKYFNIATVAAGIAALFAQANLTAQAAAISATTLYATPATNGAGMYRLSWSAVITQAATSSSTLGGTNGFQIVFTDNDTGASVTTPAGSTSSANTVGTQLNGSVIINAKVSTNIQYQFGYTSSGATPMQYALHIRMEYLG